MDKYEVLGSLGEGSFGRVYKAKRRADSTIVALKVISKRGRSNKEITGLRGECDIQKRLNHPNIIKMLDSFETKDEIVVITEFAHKELYRILGKKGYLREEHVQPIVWDVVSALYYLHTNRILHRDLKPQNILLDRHNRAKLCDFGLARSMSMGTIALTSIKGTPLYMAPELIDAQSYNHTADLWSLGCIIYELLLGAPPFNTTSFFNLIKLVRMADIVWPTFLSEACVTFLKGLLQKNPKDRMSWSEIIKHPFVEGHIILTNSADHLHVSDIEVSVAMDSISKIKLTDNNEGDTVVDVAAQDCTRFVEDVQPIENDEWTMFLLKSMIEIKNGDLITLTDPNLIHIILNPLKNCNANAKVIYYAVCCLTLPLVYDTVSEQQKTDIRSVYIEVQVVMHAMCAIKNMRKSTCAPNSEQWHTLGQIFQLTTNLVYMHPECVKQFCDSIHTFNMQEILATLLIQRDTLAKVVAEILALFIHVLRCEDDNDSHALIEQILTIKPLPLTDLLKHNDFLLRQRSCLLLLHLIRRLELCWKRFWEPNVRETLEALMYDSIETVRNMAANIVAEIKARGYYE